MSGCGVVELGQIGLPCLIGLVETGHDQMVVPEIMETMIFLSRVFESNNRDVAVPSVFHAAWMVGCWKITIY